MVPPIKLWGRASPRGRALDSDRLPHAGVAGRRPRRQCSACLMGARRLGKLSPGSAATWSSRASTRSSTARRRPTGARSCIAWQAPGRGRTTPSTTGSANRCSTPSRYADPYARDNPGGARLVIGFGTSARAKGPMDRLPGRLLRRRVPEEVAGPDPAQPGRVARADGQAGPGREGGSGSSRCASLHRNTLTPVFPGANENTRATVILRLLGVLAGVLAKAVGGRMPADQETIRYTRHLRRGHGWPSVPHPRSARRRRGRALLADGEDTIATSPVRLAEPVHRVHRVAFTFVVERLGLAVDSGGPGAVPRRARIREAHQDALGRPASSGWPTGRSCSCWGVGAAGRAGPFQVTVDPGGVRGSARSTRWRRQAGWPER